MKHLNRRAILAGSALMLISLPFGATAKTIYVWNGQTTPTETGPIQCPGQNDPQNLKTTIQAGVNAASPGDTVFVCQGTYPEQVTIDKPLRLQGENLSNTKIMPPASSAEISSPTSCCWTG